MESVKRISRRRVLKSGAMMGGVIGSVPLLAHKSAAQSAEYIVTQMYRPNGLSTDLEGARCTISSTESTSRTWCRFYTNQHMPVRTTVPDSGRINDTEVRSPAVRVGSNQLVERIPFQRGDQFVVTRDRGNCCCRFGTSPDFRTVHIDI